LHLEQQASIPAGLTGTAWGGSLLFGHDPDAGQMRTARPSFGAGHPPGASGAAFAKPAASGRTQKHLKNKTGQAPARPVPPLT